MGRAADSTMEELMFSASGAGAERTAGDGGEAADASPEGAAQPVKSSANSIVTIILRIEPPPFLSRNTSALRKAGHPLQRAFP